MSAVKKAWTKSNKKEKIYQATLFPEQKDFDAALTAISTMKICTPAIVADRCKVGLSVAKKCIAIALSKGMIAPVSISQSVRVYTTTTKKEDKVDDKKKK
ncbi:Ribosomal_protein S25 [Hexamita inflata]|uniref:40S ribosomal protein S25 n=1 Tax=Hexamita inflata TaxID=28002 RepID=A0AA86P8P9_9EUKA|nr:Ribosomal protein S25 [Hexamita inflata]CAI9940659.1 Ribosomal protein S25 [Hexamita inflata]CAI9950630.1 Ribosomal protein S25 [Hexamita inflata]CAI9951987.1 Ribosomal protein S25 [Hexamita inflata]